MRSVVWLMLSICFVIRCCGLTAAFAGPREAVAVAVAVDELLQTNKPALPDHLSDNQREIKPGPAPNNVCPCGCGNVNCTCPHAQGIAAIGSKPCGVQTVADAVRSRLDQRRGEDKGEDEGPVVDLDLDAMQRALEGLRRPVVVFVADPAAGDGRCVPCENTVAELGSGDAEFSVTVKPRTTPVHFRIDSLPVIYLPDCDMVIRQAVTRETLKATLRKYPPRVPQAFGALNVGTIKGRDALRKLFAEVKQTKTGATIRFGPASLVIPPNMAMTVNLSDQGCRVSFTATKPSIRAGVGIFTGGVSVSGLSITDSRVGVEIEGRELFAVSVE